MNKKIERIIIMAMIFITLFSVTVFAAGTNPIVNAKNWFMDGIKAVFIVIVAILGIIIIVKRKVLQGIVLIVVAGIGALFVYGGPDVFQKIANLISSWF